MAKQLETPCPAPKRGLPAEFKYDYAINGWTAVLKVFLYKIREKYGPTVALEINERVCKMDDRVKTLATTIRTIFNIKGDDAETIGEVFDIWDELTGVESTILERSKTINRRKVTNCPWKTEYKDLSDWNLSFFNIMTETITQKVAFERRKTMCAGDPYCEYVWKLQESTPLEGGEEPITKKLKTPCATPKRGISWDLKYNFAMKGFEDFFRGLMYAIREKYGSAATLEIFDKWVNDGDRVKNLTKAIRTIFDLKGNDCVTIGDVLDVWDEICGYESFVIERSPTIYRRKVTKCPWKVDYKDIGDYAWFFKIIMGKTINPKTTLEMPKKMCAGDPYCDYIWRIEE